MYNNEWVAETAMNITKDIVVAKSSNADIPIDGQSGKLLAEFYCEIFNGIVETLKNSELAFKE